MSSTEVVGAIRDSILMGIYQQNFKDGAFKNSIVQSTGVVQSLNILIASSHLTPTEKDMVKKCRGFFIQYRERLLVAQPDIPGLFATHQTFQPLFNMFAEDARSRGMYIAPDVMQIMNEGGSVDKTITFSQDGMSTSETDGGIAGIPAGAPESYIKENMVEKEDMSRKLKETSADLIIKNSFRPETVPGYKMEDTDEDAKVETDDDAKNDTSKRKDDDSGFGGDFSRNLRGAFM